MHIPFRDKDEIESWAKRYLDDGEGGETYGEADERFKMKIEAARHRGHMIPGDLEEAAKWKYRGQRLLNLVRENTCDEIREITCVSFTATTERLRVGALRALTGVRWPMASAILHFAFPEDSYPIVDQRVLRTIKWPYKSGDSFNFNRWNNFAADCRYERKRLKVSMRDLDRALWYYDKKGMNQ